jgi:hypothetical protein
VYGIIRDPVELYTDRKLENIKSAKQLELRERG